MEKRDIKLSDIERILLGNTPWEFMWEVLARSIILFIFLLIVVRLMGKRMIGQLTLTEMAIMVSLGALVSLAMQAPDRGVVYGIVAISCAALFQRGLNYLEVTNAKVESITQGSVETLVEDGHLKLENLRLCRVSHQQLFAVLRNKNIFNLGKVKRVYLEACGIFSVYEANEEKPGLALLPPVDKELDMVEKKHELISCKSCGTTVERETAGDCPSCSKNLWVDAVISKN